MKKILVVLAVCILFASMSTVTSATIPKVDDMKNDMPKIETTYPTTEGGWAGEFAGAIGNLKKVDGEWEFTASGYMEGFGKFELPCSRCGKMIIFDSNIIRRPVPQHPLFPKSTT